MLKNIVELDSRFVHCQLSAIHRACVDPSPPQLPLNTKNTLFLAQIEVNNHNQVYRKSLDATVTLQTKVEI